MNLIFQILVICFSGASAHAERVIGYVSRYGGCPSIINDSAIAYVYQEELKVYRLMVAEDANEFLRVQVRNVKEGRIYVVEAIFDAKTTDPKTREDYIPTRVTSIKSIHVDAAPGPVDILSIASK